MISTARVEYMIPISENGDMGIGARGNDGDLVKLLSKARGAVLDASFCTNIHVHGFICAC